MWANWTLKHDFIQPFSPVPSITFQKFLCDQNDEQHTYDKEQKSKYQYSHTFKVIYFHVKSCVHSLQLSDKGPVLLLYYFYPTMFYCKLSVPIIVICITIWSFYVISQLCNCSFKYLPNRPKHMKIIISWECSIVSYSMMMQTFLLKVFLTLELLLFCPWHVFEIPFPCFSFLSQQRQESFKRPLQL